MGKSSEVGKGIAAVSPSSSSKAVVKKHKKSHDKPAAVAPPSPASQPTDEALVSTSTLTVEERLLRTEKELEALKYQMAVMEGLDVCRRFRHHLMYDLVKKFNIDVPPRMNTKKRTNFPLLLKAILDAGDKVPSEWRNAIRGLETLDEICQFPLGFWDSVDNSSITSDMIEKFVEKFSDHKLRAQVKDMCQCSLTCTPPCARGNGNAPSKGAKCPTMEDIQSGAKIVVAAAKPAGSSKEEEKPPSKVEKSSSSKEEKKSSKKKVRLEEASAAA